jgi:cation transport ATPase
MTDSFTRKAALEYVAKAQFYYASYNYTSAIQEINHAIALWPEVEGSSYLFRGKSYFHLGEYGKARDDLNNVLYLPQPHDEELAKQLVMSKNLAREILSEIADKEKEAREAAEKKAREAKEAVEKLRTAAEQGDADAQFNLGRSYYTGGQAVTQDYAKAIEWFGKAAAQGHAEAKDWLAKTEAAIEEEKARKAKEAKEAAKKKKLAIIGLALQLVVTAAVFFLFFSGLLNADKLTKEIGFLLVIVLPVGVPALVIGIISLLFRKRSGFSTGMCLIILIDIVMTIYITISEGEGVGMGILLLIFLSIPAIPGFIMAGKERK